jgi:hypothetical protein
MSKSDKKAARKARRERRAKRNRIAIDVTHHLISPSLKPAELKKLLDAFAKLQAKGGAK